MQLFIRQRERERERETDISSRINDLGLVLDTFETEGFGKRIFDGRIVALHESALHKLDGDAGLACEAKKRRLCICCVGEKE